MIRCAKLAIPFNLRAMKNELALLKNEWRTHFNVFYYEGSWTALALRSAGGSSDRIIPDLIGDEIYLDTVWMQHFPSVKELIGRLGCPVMSVRFLNLKAGSVIKEHKDPDLSFEHGEARLHFPVITNPGVSFYIEDQVIPLHEGDCWYINANLPHRVLNQGIADRVHLVIDCKVNNWLGNVVTQQPLQISYKKESANNDQLKIIAELRLQNTPVSNRLAEEIEMQLKSNNGK